MLSPGASTGSHRPPSGTSASPRFFRGVATQGQEEQQEVLRFPHLKVNRLAAKEEGIRRVRDKMRSQG